MIFACAELTCFRNISKFKQLTMTGSISRWTHSKWNILLVWLWTVFIVLKIIIELPGTAITIAIGHEPGLYEALYVIAGPFLKFTMVKLKRTK